MKRYLLYFVAALSVANNLIALPAIDYVAAGDMTITGKVVAGMGESLHINQTSDKAIINWHKFNIAADEKVHFQQPSNGVCLNRIYSANGPSQIDGSLSATGKIILINRAGVISSDAAQINVGSLVVLAANYSDADFLRGTEVITTKIGTEIDNVINMAGTIRADSVQQTEHGVMLVAADNGTVLVSGTIRADGGIVLVGNKVTVADSASLDISNGGWIGIGDAAGRVSTYNSDSSFCSIAGGPLFANSETKMLTLTTATAIKLYGDYRYNTDVVKAAVDINVTEGAQYDGAKQVDMSVNYNDLNLNLRSIKPEDHAVVYTYLNSQPLVRGKYFSRKVQSAEATEQRVQVLADRFNPAVTDGCFMNGGFMVTDADTNDFLAMANSGTSIDKGITEISYLSRPDAWGTKPANLAEQYKIPGEYLTKDYTGTALAVGSALIQYTEYLRDNGYPIKGEPIDAMRAVSLIDNAAAWKTLAKLGFDLTAVKVISEYSPDVRLQTEYRFN